MKGILTMLAAFVALFASIVGIDALGKSLAPKQPAPRALTPQDVLLALEASEARQKAENAAIWEAIRLYHPDNDEWYSAWKAGDDVRQLPGVEK
mgnify:CR=1 FL=1